MANYEERNDRFKGVETFEGYEVNDRDGEKIGKVDDLFVDESNEPEYIGVKMGFLGMNSTLIPMDICRVDESNQAITVDTEKEKAKDGPSFDGDQKISRDFERQVREHYSLNGHDDSDERGDYGAYYSDEDDDAKVGPGMVKGDTETGEFRGDANEAEGVRQPGSDLEDEDEIRVQRSEEELRTGTREREAGGVNVRKRVRTDREEVRVPTKHEEVNVERVAVNEETPDAEIGEDEVSVPVVEEEVVAEKKPVVKEELRVRKDVVEDEEVVEEDVRKEEVEVDDDSGRRG